MSEYDQDYEEPIPEECEWHKLSLTEMYSAELRLSSKLQVLKDLKATGAVKALGIKVKALQSLITSRENDL